MQFLMLLALALVWPGDAPPWTVRLASGEMANGELAQLDGETLALRDASGLRQWPLDQVRSLAGARPDGSRASVAPWTVHLADGSQVPAESITTTTDGCRLTLPESELPLELPLDAVRQVARSEPTAPARAVWQRIAAEPAQEDLLVVRRDGEVDFLPGVLGAATAEGIEFTIEEETVSVKWPRVEGWVYYRAARETPAAPLAVLHLSQGGRIGLARFTWTADGLDAELVAGGRRRWAADEILRLDFQAGRVVFLAELSPEVEDFAPALAAPAVAARLAQQRRPQRNRALGGGPLLLGGKSYARGLALHSRTRLVYVLPPESSRLLALAGIDDRRRPAGQVRLLVTADGRPLFDEVLDGQTDPVPLDCDLRGAQRLEIVVDFAGDLDVADHLNLVEARIVK